MHFSHEKLIVLSVIKCLKNLLNTGFVQSKSKSKSKSKKSSGVPAAPGVEPFLLSALSPI